MPKVNSIWRMVAMILLGFSIGIFVTIKYIAPPSQDIKVGKITIKGRGNTVTDAVDISKADESDSSSTKTKKKLFNWNRHE